MVKKSLLAIATIVAVVAVGGIGFAAWTSTVTATISSTAGTFTIVWGSFSYAAYHADGTPASYVGCSASGGGSGQGNVEIAVTNMAPGDYCVISSSITDTGNVPGSVTLTEFSGVATPCYDLYPTTCFYEDDSFHNQGDLSGAAASVSGLATAPTDNSIISIGVGGGGSIPFVSVVQLSPGAVNGEQGLTDTLALAFTGTAV